MKIHIENTKADKSTSLKTFERISKYQDLEIEIGKIGQHKKMVLPITIVILGMI